MTNAIAVSTHHDRVSSSTLLDHKLHDRGINTGLITEQQDEAIDVIELGNRRNDRRRATSRVMDALDHLKACEIDRIPDLWTSAPYGHKPPISRYLARNIERCIEQCRARESKQLFWLTQPTRRTRSEH